MIRIDMRFFLFLLYLSPVFLTGCQERIIPYAKEPVHQKAASMPQPVTIKIGELGPVWTKRYPAQVRIIHQPVGMDFYKIDWERPRGAVRIDHGKYSFEIDDVLSISSGQDLGPLAIEGLSEFDINAGMSVPSPSLIPHDEARLKTYAILQRILQAGWKITTPRSSPRLTGKDRLDYALNVSIFDGLDLNYVPTFEEWMRIESGTQWMFYADHIYLEVSFTRERTLTDPAKPGSYLLSFNLKSEAEYFRGYVEPLDRARWKELLSGELAKLQPIRMQKEAELHAKGIKIDEAYQDPPVPIFN